MTLPFDAPYFYIALSNAYASPLLSGTTITLLGILYFFLIPSLSRQSALRSTQYPFISFIVGIVFALILSILIFFFTMLIATWPLALFFIFISGVVSLLALLNLVVMIGRLFMKILGKDLPYTTLGNILLFIPSIMTAGALSLIPKLGGFIITVGLIIALGGVCSGLNQVKRAAY